ncbi:MAG: D-alanine--D-alanine ligase, partial [Helicobacter sp.]|nr:D-alanine--D-alanine ligase [Helicobacter sp.]
CDFFAQDDCVYLNEINPVPGSLAHYLFADFRAVFAALSSSLPKVRHVPIQYLFINQIRNAKGK